MSEQHEHTIGTVEHRGAVLEIDWPFEIDVPSRRDPYLAVVFLDGREVGDLPLPGFGEPYASAEQIMRIARETIASGEFDDEIDADAHEIQIDVVSVASVPGSGR